jgi:hypothetical protein
VWAEKIARSTQFRWIVQAVRHCPAVCCSAYVCLVQAQCMHDPCSLWSHLQPVSYLCRLRSSKALMASTRWSCRHLHGLALLFCLLWFDVLQELDLEGSNEETGRQLCALMTTLADFHWAQVDSVQKQHSILKYVSYTCPTLQNCCVIQCNTVVPSQCSEVK